MFNKLKSNRSIKKEILHTIIYKIELFMVNIFPEYEDD